MTDALPPTLVLPTEATSIADAAELYVAAGMPPIPLYGLRADGTCACGNIDCPPKTRGKHPIGNDWQKRASLDQDDVRDRFRAHRGNIGIALALASLVLIDADGAVGLETAKTWELPPTLTAQSGSGQGAHFIFRLAAHHDAHAITDRKVAPGLDVKVRGQFVAAPSRHASGGVYRWTHPVGIQSLPDWLFDRIRKPVAIVPAPPGSSAQPLASGVGADVETRARAYMAKVPPAIAGARGHDQAFSAARSLAGWMQRGLSESAALRLLEEYNATCQPPWSEKELTHKWAQAKAARTVPALPDRPAPPKLRAIDGGAGGGGGESSGGGGGGSPGEPDWKQELLYKHSKRTGTTLVNGVDNLVRILQLAPEWQGKVLFDDFRARIVVRDPPWDQYHRPAQAREAWTDDDAGRLQSWMVRRFLGYSFEPSITDCERAVSIVAKTRTYNPVRDYLESLEWDGTPRIGSWLTTYLGSESSEYMRLVGTWWLISAVARVMVPGCKVDTVPILEGPQGIRKSSALKVLAGEEFFNDTPIDLQSKDAYTAIQGCWFVELAELDSLIRVEATRAKAFFSSSKDRFRRAYARHESEELRQCIFVGTTNLPEYLNDPTGARRFWPIACTRIDLAALERDRDQLWAEALAEFREGRAWYPQASTEHEILGDPQAERTSADAWETRIGSWLRDKVEVTLGDILSGALGLDPKDWTARTQQRVALLVTTKLRWRKRRVRREGGGGLVWVYESRNALRVGVDLEEP